MSIKEENLIKYEGTILPGQRFAKVGNKIMPVGVGGAFEPGAGGGGSAKYYKCATVDTTAKTWTGYELVLTDGVYVVSDTETTGLVYGLGFTPIVGTIYDEKALFIISNLFTPADYLDGCVFAANMQSTSAMYNGEPVNLDNITLANAPGYSDGTKAMSQASSLYPIEAGTDFANKELSVAFSAFLSEDTSSSDYRFFVFIGNSYSSFDFRAFQDMSRVYMGGSTNLRYDFTTPSTWYHFVYTEDSSNNGVLYVNGVQQASGTSFATTSLPSAVNIGFELGNHGCYMKDLQIYNRVLDENEVADLYSKAKLPVTA